MLRKNTVMFAKLQNGKYGLRSWYGNLRTPKQASPGEDDATDGDNDFVTAEETEAATAQKTAAAS